MPRSSTLRLMAVLAIALASVALVTSSSPVTAQSGTGVLPYRNPALSVEARVADLVSRMTLEEKVGQMNMPCVYEGRLGESRAAKVEACRRFAAGTHEPGLGPGGGFFTLPNTILHEGPRQQALFLNELQEIARKTRLGIPLLRATAERCGGDLRIDSRPGVGTRVTASSSPPATTPCRP